jgi:transposase
MAHHIDADYSQQFLLPPSLEDWIGPDHPARFIREFVDALDLDGLGIRWASGEGGRPAYACGLLLKVWLYGYYERVRSTRKLERACRNHMGFIWLTGMNVPDHNTLCNFFRANKKGIRALFRKTVEVAVRAELVGFVLHAVDGTKVPARVANRGGWHKKKLEKLLAKLDEELVRLEADLEGASDLDEPSDALPEAVTERQALRERVLAALEALDEAGQKHLHPADEDARVMKCADRNRNLFGYNGQAVADEKQGIVVACETVQDCNDEHCLNAMVEHVDEQAGRHAERTVADAGYATGPELAQAQANGLDVVVALPPAAVPDPDKLYAGSNFTYDAERDVCICPHGGELTLRGTRERKEKGYLLRRYRCAVKDCPHQTQCTGDKKGRTIELNQYHQVYQRHIEKHRDPAVRADLHKRGQIIEPVFAFIKEHLGFRRFTVSGLDGARTQWALLCATYNLHKLYKHWRSERTRAGHKGKRLLSHISGRWRRILSSLGLPNRGQVVPQCPSRRHSAGLSVVSTQIS